MTFCPYCDEDIADKLHHEWVGDYPVDFDLECPKCGKEIEVDVELDPVFICHKKQRDDIDKTRGTDRGKR